MSPRPRLVTSQGELQYSIIATAWKQIGEYGAASLSLRAIARELGITAPSIYHYYPNRDALVTALIIDAYTSLGDSQLAADQAIPAGELRTRLIATGVAYREWALAYPQRYLLIFGTPIPGYQAPMNEVIPSAARSLSALVGVIEAIRQAGHLVVIDLPVIPETVSEDFITWQNYSGKVTRLSLSVAVWVWGRVHGLVSLEITGNLPPYGLQGEALYRVELNALTRMLIRE
jgi:AcrR family transcriptional regulator